MGLISNNLGRYPVKQPFQVTIFNIPKYALFKNERKNIEMIRLFYAKVLKGLRKISQQIWGFMDYQEKSPDVFNFYRKTPVLESLVNKVTGLY